MCYGARCEKWVRTGRCCETQPNIQEQPAQLLLGRGTLWRRKRDGCIVRIVGVDHHRGRVCYRTDTVRGYCLLRVWRERFSPAPMTEAPKPPMGVKPRKVHDEERSNALDEAIDRYLREDLPIPLEWVVEYNELRERLNKQGA